MKHKKLQLALLVVMIATLLWGCGAQKSESSGALDNYDAPQAADKEYLSDSMEAPEASLSTGTTATPAPVDRKLIRTVHIDAETQDMDALLPELESQINALGGYTESRELYNGSNDVRQWRNAHMTIRVPAEKADTFLSHVEGSANVTSLTEDLDDVTLQYVATESRVLALETEQDRLLELMEKAETMSDLLEIEARLTDIRYELETVASQLRLMDNQINYATIHLSLSQVTELTITEEQNVWQRIATGFMNTLKGTGNTLVNILVFLISASPALILIAVVIVVFVVIIRTAKKKRRKKLAQKKEPPATP